jgi:hypothetical protein
MTLRRCHPGVRRQELEAMEQRDRKERFHHIMPDDHEQALSRD